MKRARVLLLSLVVILAVCAAPIAAHAAPAGWTVTKVADNVSPIDGVALSGNRVAWVTPSLGQGSNWTYLHLMTQRIGTDAAPAQVDSRVLGYGSIDLSGDRLAWTTSDGGPRQVYTWKNGGLTQVTTASANAQSSVRVSGDRIAWLGSDGRYDQVFTEDVGVDAAPVQVTSSGPHTSLSLSNDRLAWILGSVANIPRPTYTVQTREMHADPKPYQLASSTQLIDTVRVSGDHYLWRTQSSSDHFWHLLGQTLSIDRTAHEVADPYPYADVVSPQISEGHAVWVDSQGHLFSNLTGAAGADVQVAQDATQPVISWDRIAWAGTSADPGCFTLKRGVDDNPVRLSPQGMAATAVRASGDGIVFAGRFSASDPWTLYLAAPDMGSAPDPVTPWIDMKPSAAGLTLRRSHGKATYTFSAVIGDPDGVYLSGMSIRLQVSRNYGNSWSTVSQLTTDSNGRASKRLSFTKAGTYYYRWRAPAQGSYTASNSNVIAVHVR